MNKAPEGKPMPISNLFAQMKGKSEKDWEDLGNLLKDMAKVASDDPVEWQAKLDRMKDE